MKTVSVYVNLLMKKKKKLFSPRISFHFKNFKPKEYLIMDSNWNDLKILFANESHYYLYYFWTGN